MVFRNTLYGQERHVKYVLAPPHISLFTRFLLTYLLHHTNQRASSLLLKFPFFLLLGQILKEMKKNKNSRKEENK